MVCSQVRCGPAIEALRHAEYGEGRGPIWMDNILCTEQDVVLEECDFAGWGIHNCGHSEDASVRCEGVASFNSACHIPYILLSYVTASNLFQNQVQCLASRIILYMY